MKILFVDRLLTFGPASLDVLATKCPDFDGDIVCVGCYAEAQKKLGEQHFD